MVEQSLCKRKGGGSNPLLGCGQVVEWSITPRCKRGAFGLRGFESLPAQSIL